MRKISVFVFLCSLFVACDNNNGQSFNSKKFSLILNPSTTLTSTPTSPIQILTTSLPPAFVSEPYSIDLTASGGDGSYMWSLVSGILPNGLAISNSNKGVLPCFVAPCPVSSQQIMGIPTETGKFIFSLQVTSGDQNVNQEYTLNSNPKLYITIEPSPFAYLGRFYFMTLDTEPQLDRKGITGWRVSRGSLPPGLNLEFDWSCEYPPCPAIISGYPTQIGYFPFTLEINALEQTVSGDFEITVSRISGELAPTQSPTPTPTKILTPVSRSNPSTTPVVE